MRLIRTFVLSASAAFVVVAALGPSSAMATPLEEVVWCKVHEQQCPAEKDFPANTVIHATTSNTVFLSSLGNIACGNSAMLLTNTELLVHGEVTNLTFGNCLIGTQACTVEALNIQWLYKGELQANNEKYEVLVSEKNPNGEPQLKVECGTFLRCTFGARVLFDALLTGETEELKVSQQLPRVGGLLCPKTFIWDGEYSAECLEDNNLKQCWIKMETQA